MLQTLPVILVFFVASFSIQAQCNPPPGVIIYTPDGGRLGNSLLADFKPNAEDQADFNGNELAYAMSESFQQVGPTVCVRQEASGDYAFNGIVINRVNDCYQELIPGLGIREIDQNPACPSQNSQLALDIVEPFGDGIYEGYFFVVYDPDNGNYFVVEAAGGGPFDGTTEVGLGGSAANPPVDPNNPNVTPNEQDIPDSGTNMVPSSTDSSLPVELANFLGRYDGKHVLLDWVTATESANDYFEVQRMEHNGNFRTISEVAGAGNSSQEIAYAFTDESPLPGQNVYRLRQVDFGGASSYSSIVSVEVIAGADGGLSVYPNPVRNNLVVRLGENWNSQVTLDLIDASGRSLRRWATASDYSSVEVNLADLPAGLYQLRAADGKQQEVRRVVKQ